MTSVNPVLVKPIHSALLSWYDQHGRHDLPWQVDKSPYPVWISEIMLQQTQVTTVIPYYQRFISAFPSVESRAAAPIDEVLHLWTGLGYYARARNLHKAAQQVVEMYQGIFPDTLEALETLPGIGRSTAAAILSICHQLPTAILDGNVKRVLARYHAIETWTGETATQKQLWELAEYHTPEKRAGDYTQAIMDLCATICRRSKPSCLLCPLEESCQALAKGLTHKIPAPKPKKTAPLKTVTLTILCNSAGEVYLQKRPPSGIWGGLWSLPEQQHLNQAGILLPEQPNRVLPSFIHTFSHFRLQITPEVYFLDNLQQYEFQESAVIMEATDTVWYNIAQPKQALGLAAPIKKLLDQFANKEIIQETP